MPKQRTYRAQADELARLKGTRTTTAWACALGVPLRTYYRYADGTRKAPEAVMKLARLVK